MSITDELRREANRFLAYVYTAEQAEKLLAIADRIDAEHERAIYDMWREHDEWVADRDAKWVKLPVDADGEVVRIGDVMVMASHPFGCEDKPFVVDRMELSRGMHGEVWCLALDTDRSCWTQAVVLRHHHAPTVEDVLREFSDRVLEWAGKSGSVAEVGTWSDVASEYIAKLRLAGDAE